MINDRNQLKNWVSSHENVFAFLVFAVPLVVRIIPEILMGPYVLGFDTMGFYIPNTLLFLHNGTNLSQFLLNGQLFYAIFVPIVAAGGSPVWAIKVISPLLLGFLGLSMYAFAQKGLGWSSPKSAFVAVLGTVYFVALRSSWDLLRRAWFCFLVCFPYVDYQQKK